MATETDPRYTLTELADLAGVTTRTVRYYISQGLLAVDAAPGPGPKYDDTHLARLRLIRRLQTEHLPLAEIRHRLEGLTNDDITVLAGEPAAPPPDSALDYIRNLTHSAHVTHRAREAAPMPRMDLRRAAMAPMDWMADMPPTPASASIGDLTAIAPTESAVPTHQPTLRSQWERIEIAPDIELHIRRPLSRATAKQVDRLIAIARDHFVKENQP